MNGSVRFGAEYSQVRRVRCACLGLLLVLLLTLPMQMWAQLPPPEAYVQVRDGHLFRQGERLRLWGINIQGPNRAGLSNYAKVDANLQRIQIMGFNAVRLWGGNVLSEVKDGKRVHYSYVKGDGSALDLMDYTIAELKKKGLIIWLTWFDTHTLTPGDADLVGDPATRERWRAAVQELRRAPYTRGRGLIFYFDVRARQTFKEHIRTILTHKNQWTGLALQDEPAIGLYELDNERQYMDFMLGIKGKTGYGHAHVSELLPPFFVEVLEGRWNSFLQQRYGTDEALRPAWGALDAGERLAARTIRLQPTYATAKSYPPTRGSDIVAFYRSLFVDTCTDLVQYIRGFSSPGRGAQVVPVICHTIASDHGLHITYSNAVTNALAYGYYWMQLADQDRSRKQQPLHAPWYSFAEQGPKWPFIHPYRPAGIPMLLYEINTYRTDKFRAEFPLLHAIGGSWSDLDGIFFYQWDYHFSRSAQELVTDSLPYSTADHGWHGVTSYSDEVFLAQMRTAGRIFVQGLLKPPSQPTIVRYGQDQLNNLRQFWYGALHNLSPTALRYGVRIAFDPQAATTSLEGPTIAAREWNGKEWRVGEELLWDTTQAFVKLDLPTVKAAGGFLPPALRFRDDVEVRDVRKRWRDPDDMAPPQGAKAVADRPYYCFTVVSDDGLALAQSRRILLSLVSTSHNLGFAFDPARVPHTGPDAQKMALGIVSRGTAPVQVNRVGATIVAPFLRGKRYRKLDFALRVFGEGKVVDSFTITPDEPLFLALFE